MITDEKVARINELSRRSRTPQGLTQAEKAEQAALRREYVEAVKQSLAGHLENTTVIGPDGTRRKLTKKEG